MEACVSTTRPSTRVRVPLALAIVGLLAGVLTVSQASAEPDRAATLAEVERAFSEAEVASERVNQLQVEIDRAKADAAALDTEIATIAAQYNEQRQVLAQAIVQQQLDSPLGPTVSLLGSQNPESFLEGLGAVQALNTSRAEALQEFTAVSDTLANRKAQLADLTASLEADRAAADAARADVQAKYQQAQARLQRLSAADRATFTKASVTKVSFPLVAPSGRSQSAIDFAQSVLGTPYRYGGSGPSGYDCSGLTSAAYRAAGITIPRTAATQYNASSKVSISDVQPGDLVFFGDLSHVGIYIGNGQVIHSPRPGRSVEVTGMRSFTKAGRFG